MTDLEMMKEAIGYVKYYMSGGNEHPTWEDLELIFQKYFEMKQKEKCDTYEEF